MDDYSALAQRIALSIREVRGCLILSRDGLVLAAHPDEEEAAAKASWLRFCVLGEPERSFVEFPDQTWAFVRRGPYAAFAVADAGVRPGVMVDQLEQILLTAESERSKRDPLRLPDAQAAPSGKPRTSLHPGAARPEEDRGKWNRAVPQATGAKAVAGPVPAPAAPPSAAGPSGFGAAGDSPPVPSMETAPEPKPVPAPQPPPEPPPAAGVPNEAAKKPVPAIAAAAAAVAAAKKAAAQPADQPKSDASLAPDGAVTALRKTPQKLVTGEPHPTEEADEVDPVMLAREFSRLLQMNADDDEGSS